MRDKQWAAKWLPWVAWWLLMAVLGLVIDTLSRILFGWPRVGWYHIISRDLLGPALFLFTVYKIHKFILWWRRT